MLTITDPASPADYDAIRALCWEYRDFLLTLGGADAEIVRTFYPEETYARVMARLETDHAAPAGGAKLVRLDGATVGCGMFHRLAPDAAEIKRVYLRDSARGRGAGRALMEALVAQCRADGYARILMDTGLPLTAARDLYLSMGFRLRDPYQEIPDTARERLLFFEMQL